jgi:hypothetical protein
VIVAKARGEQSVGRRRREVGLEQRQHRGREDRQIKRRTWLAMTGGFR